MTVKMKDGLLLPVPEEWAKEIGIGSEVELTRTGEGFHVKPISPAGRKTTWDEIFANKLPIAKKSEVEEGDDFELTGDDYLF